MLPDRVFFGHGACIFSRAHSIPSDGFAGNHIYVTDGEIAFDYHGYSARSICSNTTGRVGRVDMRDGNSHRKSGFWYAEHE
ncbi:hypothetical protein [Chelativorans salis]|uniref:DUF295 domain-containing protein n=1 Tax=Chelativorans salis TaxID=2978478 RepID=A0ABT2LRI8_9HYPH|nr:hypothetical protein [Chelativorans sp. EGI FJ00035]MCT7377156.1 hypothetical protein [Chelativorans sp. EGI FJ00035]